MERTCILSNGAVVYRCAVDLPDGKFAGGQLPCCLKQAGTPLAQQKNACTIERKGVSLL